MKIITNLNGGLGNQMFQYAFARVLATHFNCPIALNTQGLSAHAAKRDYSLGRFILDETTRIDNTNPGYNNIFIRDYRPVFGQSYSTETIASIEKLLANNPEDKNIIIEGYFQDTGLLNNMPDVGTTLRDCFSLNNAKSESFEFLNQTPVILQVRRGDFIGNSFHQVWTK